MNGLDFWTRLELVAYGNAQGEAWTIAFNWRTSWLVRAEALHALGARVGGHA